MNQKGSTLIEALIVFTLGSTLLAGCFAMAYLSFVRLWSDYQGYEAMACMAERRRTPIECTSQYWQRTRRFFPRGVDHQGTVTKSGGYAHFRSDIHLRLRWNFIPSSQDRRPHNHDQFMRQEQRLWIPH